MIVEYTCAVCGEHCRKSRSPGNMKTIPRFCSQKCSGTYKSMNKKGPTKNFTGICETCGAEFSTYKSPSRKDPRFCSLKCIGLSQTGKNNPSFSGGRYKDYNGYINVFMPDHPNCNVKKMVYEHRYIMECHIGRYLTEKEVVHHIDGDKSNNKITNLQLCSSQKEHQQLHRGQNNES